MIIFHNDKAMVTTKTDKFRLNEKLLSKIDRNLTKDADKMDATELFKKYKPEYEKLGVDMQFIKENKAFRIPIDVVEPLRKKTLPRAGWAFETEDPIEKTYTKEGKYLFSREDDEII